MYTMVHWLCKLIYITIVLEFLNDHFSYDGSHDINHIILEECKTLWGQNPRGTGVTRDFTVSGRIDIIN